MIDLAARLQTLGFDPNTDFLVQDDGEGPYIREWNSPLPQPTPAEIAAAEPYITPPDRVSRRQFFLQLEIDGIGPQVRAYVDTQPTVVQIAFDNSASFERADPMLQDGFAALGYNDGRVDKFFNDAGAL